MRDEQIIELFWQRNEQAIEETEKKYGAYCSTVGNNILQSRQDTEECVNDTWLRVWNVIPPQRPESLRVFLAKIVRNLAFDKLKARKADKRGGGEMELILDELEDCIFQGDSVESRLIAGELEESVDRFVHTLPERECNVFLRRYFFAESAETIAKRYGFSSNNVMVILSRSRRKLKAYLKKEGYFQ